MSTFLSITKEDVGRVLSTRADIGATGEQLAADYLERNGYTLVLSNFKVPIGRNTRAVAVTGEIDIVALDGDQLCFVEVKTRLSDKFAEPLASVTTRKQRQITRTARVYRRIFRLTQVPHRFDVVSIVLTQNAEPKLDLIKDFWTEGKFRKKSWSGDIY